MVNESQNAKGEYALYENGKLIGYSPVTFIGMVKVVNKYLPNVNALINAAKKDGVSLVLDSGFRTWEEQYNIRVRNVIDKSKVNDRNYIMTANNGLFSPRTAMPGYSNHQNGDAYDFNVNLPNAYKWLVHNAIQYGWIRTVPTEIWHWQYLPSMSKFSFVHQDDKTWNGLT